VKLKVVVIDDDSEQRKNIRNSLISEGYEVLEAENGAIGLELIQKENPDLILCDIRMPKMNGDELLETIRNSDNEMGIIPFIFISGYADAQEKIFRLKQGADNCFEKPLDLELLSAYVKSHLTGVARVSNYMKERLDTIAHSISSTLDHDFNAYKSMSTNVDSYVETIIHALHKYNENKQPFSIEHDTKVSRMDYVDFFLEEYGKRKNLASTANGEDLSWLLIFLVARSFIQGEKLPISDLYVSAPSAKSTINARISSLIDDDIFVKVSDPCDGRRQLVTLSDSFQADLLSHIDSSVDLIKEKIL